MYRVVNWSRKNNRTVPNKDRTEGKLNEKKIIVHVRLFSTREYEVFVYNSLANILDLEPSSRKVFSKVLLYKAPRSRSYVFSFSYFIFFFFTTLHLVKILPEYYYIMLSIQKLQDKSYFSVKNYCLLFSFFIIRQQLQFKCKF